MATWKPYAAYNASRNPYDATKMEIARYCAFRLYVFEPHELQAKLEADYGRLPWSKQQVSNILAVLLRQEDVALAPPQLVSKLGRPRTRATRMYTGAPIVRPVLKGAQ